MLKLWWNYKTKTYDTCEEVITDKVALKYIPYTRFARTTYKKFRKVYGIKDSMYLTLNIFRRRE